jgi:hypothetical protein
MLAAQATTPAPTPAKAGAESNAPVLTSRLGAPSFGAAAKAAAADLPSRPVSSGVIPARVLETTAVDSASGIGCVRMDGCTFRVLIRLDSQGRPTATSMTASDYALMNPGVLASVNRWRYSPSRVSGVPVSSDLNLVVRVHSR